MDTFLELFGGYTIADAVKLILAAGVIFAAYKKGKTYLAEHYKKEQAKEERLHQILEQVEQYPKWRQQSIDIQKQFTDSITALKEGQEMNTKKLLEIEESNQKRERNKLREQLLQSYRYYTSKEKNPIQAWSEMEADAFWGIFGDYEDSGGNGHVHTVVQPSMRLLEVIPMHEEERLAELMQSRK